MRELTATLAQASRLRVLIAIVAALATAIALVPMAAHADHGQPRDVSDVCPPPDDYDTQDADFDDVTDAHAHSGTIECAAQYGIARGYPDGDYRPQATVSREHMASFVARLVETATGEELSDLPPVPPYTDTLGRTHESSINKLTNAGIVEGYGDLTFRPTEPVYRAPMASFIAKAIDYADNGDVDGSAPPATDQTFFADVEGNVHEGSINRLAAQHIVVGTSTEGAAARYNPWSVVPRGQMTAFLVRGADYLHELDAWDPTIDGEVTNTDTGETYDSLNAALAEAEPGHTLTATGVFREDVEIFENEDGDELTGLTLQGESTDDTRLRGDLTVTAEDVTVANFTIRGDLVVDGEGFTRDGLRVDGTESGEAYSIQQAVDDTPEGGTITVGEGTYEENVEIDVTDLALEGAEGEDVVLHGSVLITADGVIVAGFTVEELGTVRGEIAAFYIDGAEGVVIADNLVDGETTAGTTRGLITSGAVDAAVVDNTFLDLTTAVFANAGAELFVAGNHFEGNTAGVGTDSDEPIEIYDNTFVANDEGVGIGGENVVINGNVFDGNDVGVQSYVNTETDATENWWGDASGPDHPDNADGTGDPVVDGDNGGQGTVEFAPWCADEECDSLSS